MKTLTFDGVTMTVDSYVVPGQKLIANRDPGLCCEGWPDEVVIKAVYVGGVQIDELLSTKLLERLADRIARLNEREVA